MMRSLLDEGDFSTIGAASEPVRTRHGQRIKLAVAALLFVCAGVLMSHQLGLLTPRPAPEPVDPAIARARVDQIDDLEAETQARLDRGEATISGP